MFSSLFLACFRARITKVYRDEIPRITVFFLRSSIPFCVLQGTLPTLISLCIFCTKKPLTRIMHNSVGHDSQPLFNSTVKLLTAMPIRCVTVEQILPSSTGNSARSNAGGVLPLCAPLERNWTVHLPSKALIGSNLCLSSHCATLPWKHVLAIHILPL